MHPHMNQNEIQRRVYRAISLLLRNDMYLLSNDVAERAITHRLAVYLESEFKGWNVDCEYNRHNGESKALRRWIREDKIKEEKNEEEDTSVPGSLVYPDIVIHLRGTDINLLVIEVKKSNNRSVEEGHDIRKIKSFINELHYENGLFLEFKCEKRLLGTYLEDWYPKLSVT